MNVLTWSSMAVRLSDGWACGEASSEMVHPVEFWAIGSKHTTRMRNPGYRPSKLLRNSTSSLLGSKSSIGGTSPQNTWSPKSRDIRRKSRQTGLLKKGLFACGSSTCSTMSKYICWLAGQRTLHLHSSLRMVTLNHAHEMMTCDQFASQPVAVISPLQAPRRVHVKYGVRVCLVRDAYGPLAHKLRIAKRKSTIHLHIRSVTSIFATKKVIQS